jgi:hypothetical protein
VKLFSVAFVWIFCACLAAQEPAGVIEGSLRDATSRAPLADARVALRGPVSRSVTTAPGGSFRFDQLPPGDYDITFQRSGYLDSSRASVHQAVRLKAGAVTESVVIDLTPLGAIEGAVLDETGQPLADVSVSLAGSARPTDREGRYMFEDVVPGSYQVAVGVPHTVRARNLERDSGSGDYYGYAPAQYYPGADDPRLAIPVVVPAGTRLRNVDLRLRRTLLVEFSGRILDMAGREPVSNARVELRGAVAAPPDPQWIRPASALDGSFRFSLIQPGEYTLLVTRQELSALPYAIPIQIGKTGVDDMPIAIPPFVKLQGTIQFRDPKVRWTGTASIRITHRSGGSVYRDTRPDGTFEIENVPPGDYQFDVQARNLRLRSDIQRRVSASAVRFGSQNALRRTVTIGENGNPTLEVQFTDEPAGISGTVVESNAPAGAHYVVTVAALVPRRAMLEAMTATPEFQFPELAPGDYELTAIRSPARISGTFNNIKGCDETVRVTVREGVVSTVTLRPCL